MPDQPYITFVVVARNDNYGGDFICRINVFVRNIITLCEKHLLPSELLIVEWNPPEDRPRVKDSISWPDIRRNNVQIKIVEVSKDIHKKLNNPERMLLFEYIGKNVGIRRAEGEYILTTNPDTLVSEDLIQFLSLRRLRLDRFYRIDRHDVRTPIPLDVPVERQLQYCRENVIRIHGYFWSCHDPKISGRFWRYRQLRSFAGYVKSSVRHFLRVPPHLNAPGDFILMHRNQWKTIRGFPELETQGKSHHIDSLAVYMARLGGIRQIILKGRLKLYHQDHWRPEPERPMAPAVRHAFEQVKKAKSLDHLAVLNTTWGLEQEDFLKSSL